MKKIFALAFAATLVTGFVSCGPSEEQKKADSTDVAKTAKSMNNDADSMIAMMNRQNDSTEKANAEAKKADSAKNSGSAKPTEKK